MSAINTLLKLIKKFEGCELHAYPDPGTGGKPWTCGWGTTGDGITSSTVWTQQQADDILRRDAQKCIDFVKRVSPDIDTDNRIAAIADFVYNCGEGNYRKSTLKVCVDQGHWEAAKVQILRWDKASGKVMRGLHTRRLAESDLL